MDTKTIERNIGLIETYLSKSIAIGHSIMAEVNETLEYPIEFTAVNLLERLCANLKAVSKLIPYLAKEQELENGIGLILRANLSDFLILCYLTTKANISEEELTKGFHVWQYEHFRFMEGELVSAVKMGITTDKEAAVIKKNILKNYSFVTENTAHEYSKERMPGMKEMVSEIVKHSTFKEHVKAYDYYIYYSKYEHYGALTYGMQRASFEKDLDRIKYAIFYTICCMELIAVYLKKDSYLTSLNTLKDSLE